MDSLTAKKVLSACTPLAIECFLTLCETRSFSESAKNLNKSQSNLSKIINRLEANLGVTLIDRTTRPCTITEEGFFLERELRHSLNSLQLAFTTVRKRSSIKPTLRLGSVESLTSDLVPGLIKEIQNDHSSIEMRVSPSDILIEQLQRKTIDVALVSYDYSEIKGVKRLFLLQEPSVLLLPNDLDVNKKWTWEDLKLCGYPLITSFSSSGGGRLNSSYFSSLSLDFQHKIAVDFNGVMVELIKNKLGWALSRPSTLLQTRTDTSEISIVPMPEPTLNRRLYVMHREGEFGCEGVKIQKICREILLARVLPKIIKIAPWTREKLLIPTLDGEDEEGVGINRNGQIKHHYAS